MWSPGQFIAFLLIQLDAAPIWANRKIDLAVKAPPKQPTRGVHRAGPKGGGTPQIHGHWLPMSRLEYCPRQAATITLALVGDDFIADSQQIQPIACRQ